MKLLIFLLLMAFSDCYAGNAGDLDTEWWKHTIIYQILPYSFKDSDGDGIGDLKGVTSKLDHFVDLKVETLHLTPIFQSTFRDMGYDITNYYEIYPPFGTMDDFDELIREMNKRGMKLILDLVINHSGDKHEWFQKSVDRINPYTNFYVWKDAIGYDENGAPIAPNKWVSVFLGGVEGSAWKWNDKRKQFYLHQFTDEQVDFNLNNSILKRELKKIINFWLNKGVAGFRLDAVIFFMEDKYFRDDNNHLRQLNQAETYEFVHELRLFLDRYNRQHGGLERIFIAEAHSDDTYVLQYYDKEDYPITHYPYAFQLEYIHNEVNAHQFNEKIEPWIQKLPENAVSLWMTQDHDGRRVGSRIRPEYSDIFTMATMMLPGAMGCYYGQEIAMLNGRSVEPHEIKDFSGNGDRDPTRLIMQWDESFNAGFTSNFTPYLPPNFDFSTRNVDFQKTQQISHYNMFKDLSTLRTTDVFKNADFKTYIPSDNIYIFTRSYKNTTILIVINFGHLATRVALHPILSKKPQYASVAAASVNAAYQKGFEFNDNLLDEFIMTPLSSLTFSILYRNDSSSQPTSSNMQFTITNENGIPMDIQVRDGVVKVDGNVVYIAHEQTNFAFDHRKIYANKEPVFDLNTRKSAQFNLTSPTATNEKPPIIEINRGVVKVNGKVINPGSPYSPVTITNNKIYVNGQKIYDLSRVSTNQPNKMVYTLVVGGKTTTIGFDDGDVKVNGEEKFYSSSAPSLTVTLDTIYLNGVSLSSPPKQNPPTNSKICNSQLCTINKSKSVRQPSPAFQRCDKKQCKP